MIATVLVLCAAAVPTCDALLRPSFTLRARVMSLTATTPESGLNVEDLFNDSPTEVHDKVLKTDGDAVVPAWLKGALIRNGPGLFGAAERRFDHIFDGLAKLTRYNFVGDGTVRFSTRFLRGNVYDSVKDCGDIPPGPYTGPVNPPFNRWQKLKGAITSISTFDNVPVNVHQVGDLWKPG